MDAWPIVVGVVAFAVGAATVTVRERARRRSVASAAERASDDARRTAEASEAELRSMTTALSSMQEGVLLFGPDGTVTYANAALEQHLGERPASIDGLLPLGLRDAARRAAMTHLSARIEVETGSPTRWLWGSATPVGDDDSVLLVIRDVTEARRLDAVRRDFVANASHELKTPLASIRAAAETIGAAAKDDPDVLPRFARQLERDATRMSRIVSDLLDLSRLETGSDAASTVQLGEVVREEVARFHDAAETTGVALVVRIEEIRVPGSERDLSLLVRNLVDNAVRYTPHGGQVAVELELGDEEAVLAIVDTGIGISARDLPRIFERFYRVDQARSRATGGTGLGLSIVKHVVENHGGTVSVASELGRGTRVEVRLPAATG